MNTNGAAIQVAETDKGDPALVFLHYWGGSSRTWQDVIDLLGGSPRSIALDQRGWGGSVATDGRYDLSAMADDAEAVARILGLNRYVLVGHSMGGQGGADRRKAETGYRPCACCACAADTNAGARSATRRDAGVLRLP
jgi:pimeloyl-ACP methyl ester carboxylesterase